MGVKESLKIFSVEDNDESRDLIENRKLLNYRWWGLNQYLCILYDYFLFGMAIN